MTNPLLFDFEVSINVKTGFYSALDSPRGTELLILFLMYNFLKAGRKARFPKSPTMDPILVQ